MSADHKIQDNVEPDTFCYMEIFYLFSEGRTSDLTSREKSVHAKYPSIAVKGYGQLESEYITRSSRPSDHRLYFNADRLLLGSGIGQDQPDQGPFRGPD